MKIRFNRFLPFLVLAISLSSISLGGIAQKRASSVELEKSMKTFRGRLRVYRNCLRRKCSNEERKIAAKAAIKDGFKLALLIAGTIFLVRRLSTYQAIPKKLAPLDTPDNLFAFFNSLGITETNLREEYGVTLKDDFAWNPVTKQATITLDNPSEAQKQAWQNLNFRSPVSMLLDLRGVQVTGPPYKKTGPQLIITIPAAPQQARPTRPATPQQTRPSRPAPQQARPSRPILTRIFPSLGSAQKLSSKDFETARQGIANFLARYQELQQASGRFHIIGEAREFHVGHRGRGAHYQSTFTIHDLPDEEAVDKVQQFIKQQHGEGLAIPKEMAVNIVADKPNKKVTLTISAFIK